MVVVEILVIGLLFLIFGLRHHVVAPGVRKHAVTHPPGSSQVQRLNTGEGGDAKPQLTGHWPLVDATRRKDNGARGYVEYGSNE